MLGEEGSLLPSFIIVSGGPGAKFLGLEIHVAPEAPLSGPSVGADTNCETRCNSLRRLLGVTHGERGRSSPPGPGELGRIPGSFTGGQDWGIGPRSLPPPPSPSPPERMAEGYPQLPVPAPLLPRLGIVPICSFLFSAFPILSAKEGWPLLEGSPPQCGAVLLTPRAQACPVFGQSPTFALLKGVSGPPRR